MQDVKLAICCLSRSRSPSSTLVSGNEIDLMFTKQSKASRLAVSCENCESVSRMQLFSLAYCFMLEPCVPLNLVIYEPIEDH